MCVCVCVCVCERERERERERPSIMAERVECGLEKPLIVHKNWVKMA